MGIRINLGVHIGPLIMALITLAGATSATDFSAFSGSYIVVTARAASDVAGGPINLAPQGEDSPIGQSVVIGENGLQIEGLGCDTWTADFVGTLEITDPSLVDMALRDRTGTVRPAHQYEVRCEGVFFTTVLAIDARVVLMSFANAREWLVLEAPLSKEQSAKLSKSLMQKGLLDQPANPQLVQDAVRAYFESAFGEPESGTPLRIAMTETLLEGLDVLDVDANAWEARYRPSLDHLKGPWRATDSGIRCITSPCPTFRLTNGDSDTVLISEFTGIDKLPHSTGQCTIQFDGAFYPDGVKRQSNGDVIERYVRFDIDPNTLSRVGVGCP